MKVKNKNQNPEKQKILKIITDNHVLTKKELEKKSNFTQSIITKLIIQLQKEKMISYEKILGKKRIFRYRQKRRDVIMSILKKEEIYKKIFELLTRKKTLTLDEFKDHLGKARSTTYVHLEKLVEEEVIKKVLINRKPCYQV